MRRSLLHPNQKICRYYLRNCSSCRIFNHGNTIHRGCRSLISRRGGSIKMGPRQQPTILRHRPSLSLTMLYPEIMIGIGVYLPGSNLISSITVPNEEQEEKRQQHIILCRIFQTIDESEQYWWWFRSWQICVLGSEGKSSIIVHQGFSRIMMKNVAINKSAFDYYLYMNFICKYICFFQIIFFVFLWSVLWLTA